MTRKPSLPAPRVTDSTIVLPGCEPLAVRIYGKKTTGAVMPLVLHLHGGAFTAGSLDCGACLAQLVTGAGAVVVSLAYPLAPAHPFPQAVEAGYAGLEWVYKHRARLAGKDAPVYVAGEEAGGNLAAAVAMVARDRAHPPLAGQILVAPMLDPCTAMPSQREAVGDATGCKWADGWHQYLRSPMDAEHPYAVPAHAQRLADLPPALILTGADDAMRDEALAYAARLRKAGIPVTSDVLGDSTGWPDALGAPPDDECPCGAAVQQHLRAFFSKARPLPPPS
ncbi:MAG: alpha/beta hydrolase [Ramlibacter sp.]|nr:alpha/beta hydrolase [Ramlibacter sp.]MBX3657834.1 alpha/beta hydrolase [Ramlibacter sp.]